MNGQESLTLLNVVNQAVQTRSSLKPTQDLKQMASPSLLLSHFPRQNNLVIPKRTAVPLTNNKMSGYVPPVNFMALF